MSQWIYLLLSALCSLAIVHLLKVVETRGLRTLNTLTVNYLVAALFSFGVIWWQGSFEHLVPDPGFLLFTAVTGAFFITNFLAYSKSVNVNGVGVSVAAMRLSLLLPIVVSLGLYGEVLTLPKILGLVLVFIALGLLMPSKRSARFKNISAGWLLVAIFLLTGFTDSSLKVYQEDFSGFRELVFMGYVFLHASLIGLVLIVYRRGKLVTLEEIKQGTLIGIPNLYSSVFLIFALSEIDGSVAYPVVNVLNVTGGTLLGLWWWKDRISRWQWTGLVLSLIAILLLL